MGQGHSYYGDLLSKRLAELVSAKSLASNYEKPVELDQQSVGRLSRMDAMQMQEMALESSRRRDNEINAIKQALLRIEQGNYGYCLHCEEDISANRLELSPAITTCIDCAK